MRIPESGIVDLVRRDWRMVVDPLDGALRQYEAHGPVVFEKWGPLRLVNLFGPDANELVLLNRDGIFSHRRAWNQFIGDIFPNGLMLRDGDDHRLHRRVMRAGFTKAALTTYLETMNPLIERQVASLPPTVHAYEWLKSMTLELAWNVFVGETSGSQHRHLNHAFETAVAASLALVRLRVPPFLLWRGIRARLFIRDYFRTLLARKRAGSETDMFGLLARAEGDDGERFSDDDVLDHMVFMMMAAHDTTTSTLSSMLYELARNVEWQERCREEVLSIGRASPTIEDLDRMVVTTAVMQEALRRYPPLPVFPRVNTRAFEFRGYRIPAGTIVVVHPVFTHHMPSIFRDPMRFDPSRFLEPRSENKAHRFAWVPFGGGAHLCLGMHFAEMQIKAMSYALLRRYSFRVRPGYEMPFTRVPISKPTDGLPLELTPVSEARLAS